MKLVHIYRTKQGCSIPKEWDITDSCHVAVSALGIKTQGFIWLWEQLLGENLVDEISVIYNVDKYYHNGSYKLADNLTFCVMPYIGDIELFCEKGDIVVARSWGKCWHDALFPLLSDKTALWYAAGYPMKNRKSGSVAREVFDYVLADCACTDRGGQLHSVPRLPFLKPIHPQYFYPAFIEPEYDVCIGGSEITGKKGQLNGVRAIKKYRELYGKNLKCILPGPFHSGKQARALREELEQEGFDIQIGRINAEDMGRIYNQSKMLLHLAYNGSNDRSVLEAMACGTPVMMREDMTEYHAPFTFSPESETRLTEHHDKPEKLAKDIHDFLPLYDNAKRKRISDYFWSVNNRDAVLAPWRQLLDKTAQ